MDLDTLKPVWQSQDVPAASGEGVNMTALFGRLDRLDRDVRNRDLRESLAAFFNIAFFSWQAAIAPSAVARAGATIVVLGSAFVILWSRRAVAPPSRQPFVGDLPLAQFCRRELERVEAQIRLLRTVWWWYLGPTTIGIELMLWGFGHGPMAFRVTLMLLTLVVAIIIYALNVAASRTGLEPLRDELRRNLAELQTEP